MKPFTFEKAKNPAEALKLKLANKDYVAGGTNIVDLLKKNIAQPDGMIDISTSLSNEIKVSGKSVSIGSMVRNTALTTNTELIKNFPLITKSVLAGASPQIRNMASTAGNLLQRTRCPYFYDVTTPCNKRKKGSGCSALNGDNKMSAIVGYSEDCVAVHPSDLCISLSALDANVYGLNSKNEKFVIPFKDFHKLPGNTPWMDNTLPQNSLITHIEVPKNEFHKKYSYVKLRERTSYAFAMISVASALQMDGNTIKEARLASGGVAHKPWRWYEVEDYLKGKKASDEVFKKASEIAVEKVKPLSQNAYKVPMLKGAIELALQNAVKL
ncbi:Putative xanthine dehydrogenase YagS FAD-binding subunit [Chryseobacterium aquaeductus]|uniref:Xanthine dehydrogenase YagS FAD-binding subunit n=1 Tax=Chryseobacterium aquaeductus TaxID=2675056 RepID=A0A9N8MIE1_9FLAO|nr:xanthine dehydrogenase family protein subunit M [Chryseobacterium aquaeductus]CAA7332379.1 Putative xanthine dehydrogenase YagS FAD-binding subunit [Chryseobacterium potabilaquae]CAD7816104.1 Putative xanthine dehydrogenase YagS FAD-binding subunit [Chryseobacterium aquaeductus]